MHRNFIEQCNQGDQRHNYGGTQEYGEEEIIDFYFGAEQVGRESIKERNKNEWEDPFPAILQVKAANGRRGFQAENAEEGNHEGSYKDQQQDVKHHFLRHRLQGIGNKKYDDCKKIGWHHQRMESIG